MEGTVYLFAMLRLRIHGNSSVTRISWLESTPINSEGYISILGYDTQNLCNTRWFKYDRD